MIVRSCTNLGSLRHPPALRILLSPQRGENKAVRNAGPGSHQGVAEIKIDWKQDSNKYAAKYVE